MPTGDNIARFGGALLMNELSAFVWKKLQQPMTRDELLSAILDEYDIDEKTAAQDLDALLTELKEMQVIEA